MVIFSRSSEFNFREVYNDWFEGAELNNDQIDYLFEYIDALQSSLREISDGCLTRNEAIKLARETLKGD